MMGFEKINLVFVQKTLTNVAFVIVQIKTRTVRVPGFV